MSGKRRAGSLVMGAGALLLTAALALTGFNLWDSRRAGEAAEAVSGPLPRQESLCAALRARHRAELEAAQRFRRLRRCRNLYARLWRAGVSVERLTVAA